MSDRIGDLDAGPSGRRRRSSDLSILDWREALNKFAYRLTQLHQRLDEQIRAEMKRRAPDALNLLRLKRLRLRVKDRLHAHSGQQQLA
ncbi:DUF465 domain-containing protein [Sphingomonas sp. 3-13AW]|jgi:hypothetical protein|uniref:DUF465 domain-containing protein n=1 Tax=Sphingomonas sp. 3-13AW TaxID=3050450 RepID=UPI003BB4A518